MEKLRYLRLLLPPSFEVFYYSTIRVACSDLQRAVRSAVLALYRIQLFDVDSEKLTNTVSFLPLSLQSE